MRVVHLVGSPTSRFFAELSLTYARECVASIPGEHEVAYVSPDGSWRFPSSLDGAALVAAPAVPVGEAVGRLASLGADVMVPHLFCRSGMTAYRALFEVLGIPYVGNPPDVMALGAHKARARAVVAAAGVDVPVGEVVRPGESPSVGLPAVVKPVDADNSVGVTLVSSPSQWPDALAAAFAESSAALVEEFVPPGREVRCGVVERDGVPVALPLEEYAVATVRGYDDKIAYSDAGVSLLAKTADRAWIVDAADPVTHVVGELAVRCHIALGCRHYSLVDVRIDPSGRPWFLEASPYCSFAPSSVVATMAAAAGIPLADLFTSLAAQAVGVSAESRC